MPYFIHQACTGAGSLTNGTEIKDTVPMQKNPTLLYQPRLIRV